MMIGKDFREFLKSLNDHRVRYLIIGGYAVAFHGHPRYTKDLDLWIDPDKANIVKLLEAIRHFGFSSLALTEKDFHEPDTVIQLGQPPHRIDLFVSVLGVDFTTCYDKKETIVIEGISVHFIDLNNLKRNKTATGRFQDLADVENLEGGRPTQSD